MANSLPLISVVMPCYNGEDYLLDSINSVLNQSYSNLELVVVDDGSTDGSARIINELALKDARLKYFYQSNSGSASARNKAVDESSGELIAFIDADDLWSRHKLSTQYKALQEFDEYQVVCGIDQHVEADFDGENVAIEPANSTIVVDEAHSGWQLNNILPHTYFHINNLLITRAVADSISFNSDYRRGQDSDYFFQLCLRYQVLYLKEVLSYYRIHSASITQSVQSFNVRLMMVERFLNNHKSSVRMTSKQKRRLYFSLHFTYANHLRTHGQFLQSFNNFLKAWYFAPFELGIYKNILLCFLRKR